MNNYHGETTMIYTIYKIQNEINLKCYIGYTNNFKRRIREHKNAAKDGDKNAIYCAIRKYGIENFTFEIIYQSTDKDYCLHEMETYFINQYDSIKNGYNLTRGGQSREGFKNKTPNRPRTEEEKKKISQATKKAMADLEIRQRMLDGIAKLYNDPEYIHPLKGRKLSEENIQKLKNRVITDEWRKNVGIASKKMWENEEIRKKHIEARRNISDETREKMSVAKIGKPSWNKGISPSKETREKHRKKVCKTYTFLSPKKEIITTDRLKEFCLTNGLAYSSMNKFCNGYKNEYKGYSLAA
jgi:group I intron endonuclease